MQERKDRQFNIDQIKKAAGWKGKQEPAVFTPSSGRIDSYSAPDLEDGLKNLTEESNYKIVVDLTDVNFMSAKGWWVLIETQKTCKRYNRGELVLLNPLDRIKESLDLAGMSNYFNIITLDEKSGYR